MSEPPEGYLGADARIGSGPAPELVEAGYRLELADTALLHRPLGLADLAHTIALDAIPDEDRRALLAALLDLLDTEIEVDARYGDLANVRERWLEQRIGHAAGWLNAGRPRREAGRIAFRLALRPRVLDLAAAVARFAGGADRAGRARARHADARLHVPPGRAAHDRRPLGALVRLPRVARRSSGCAGTSRGSTAAPAERAASTARASRSTARGSPRCSASARSPGTRATRCGRPTGSADLVTHAAIAATGASRFAEDLELYGSEEFGLLRIGDELCRASALMPQKRNPYALVVLRGGAGTLIGRATGVLATQRTPSGRTDNLLYAYGEVAGSVELAARLLRLAAATAESITFDRERAARAVHESFALATDLAEAISFATGLDYRSAYRVVGRAAAAGTLDSAALDAAAVELLGRPLALDAAFVAAALDPVAALGSRVVPGGAAPEPMDAMLHECRDAVAEVAAWVDERARRPATPPSRRSWRSPVSALRARRTSTALGRAARCSAAAKVECRVRRAEADMTNVRVRIFRLAA